jgi:hypothetical protein
VHYLLEESGILTDRRLGYLVLAAGAGLFLLLGSLGHWYQNCFNPPASPAPAAPQDLALPPPAPELTRQAARYALELEQRGVIDIAYGGDLATIIYMEPKFWQLLTHREKEGVALMFALVLQDQARQQPHLIRFPYFSVLDMTSKSRLARVNLLNPEDHEICR